MISDADRSVEKLLQQELGAPLPFDLSFNLPDKNFAPVSGSKNTLNCYLYDIRENRDLRSTEVRLINRPGGRIEKQFPPARIKLSYCITAWSPMGVTAATPPALDEHALLASVLRALLKHPVFPASALMGTLANQEPPPPTTVALPETSRNGSDFWTAIGGQLRPSLDFAFTISLDYEQPSSGPAMTSITGRAGLAGAPPGASDPLYLVGGIVRDSAATPRPLAGAWVRVNQTGATYVTDDLGRFIAERLAPGAYTLTVRAVGFQEATRAITVPQPDGVYDVTLVPL
jgi:hypothetical protein